MPKIPVFPGQLWFWSEPFIPIRRLQASHPSEKVKMLFLLNFESCSVHKTRASFYTPHSVVLLAKLMPLQVDLTPHSLSQHIAPSAAHWSSSSEQGKPGCWCLPGRMEGWSSSGREGPRGSDSEGGAQGQWQWGAQKQWQCGSRQKRFARFTAVLWEGSASWWVPQRHPVFEQLGPSLQ